MIPTYLSKVVISNFRSYGANTEIPINPTAGLTIVCGMNGLGKTAFFDAIEWALTNDVQRISGNSDALTRLGAESGSHSVTLSFLEGERFERSRNADPRSADLVDFFKRAEWKPEINNLATYFKLTHFLPQSSNQRFLEKDENSQWQLLKGPAGVERLERFRTLLHDRKARNAFVRRIEELSRKQSEIHERFTEFKRTVERCKELQSLAIAGIALSPAQIHGIIDDIYEWLRKVSSFVEPAPTALNLPDRLAILAAILEELQENFDARSFGLSKLEPLIGHWSQLASQQKELEEKTKVFSEEAALHRVKLGEATVVLNAERQKLKDVQQAGSKTKSQAEALHQIVLAKESVDKLKVQTEAVEKLLSETNSALEQQNKRAKDNSQVFEKITGLLRDMDYLRRAETEFATATERFNQAEASRIKADVMRREHDKIAARRLELTRARESAQATVSQLQQTLGSLRKRLESAQVVSNAIASAVAEIVSHLTEQHTECPVCSHTFEPGELIEKARAAVNKTSPESANLIDEITAIEDRLRKAVHQTETTANDERKLLETIQRLDEQLQVAQKQRDNLERDVFFSGTEYHRIADFLKEKGMGISSKRAGIDEQIKKLPSRDSIMAERQEIESRISTLKGEQKRHSDSLLSMRRTMERNAAVLQNYAELIQELGDSVVAWQNHKAELLRLEETHRAESEKLVQVISDAENRERMLKLAIKEAEAREFAVKNEIAKTRAASEEILKTWQLAGFESEPNDAALARARRELLNRQSALETFRIQQRKAVQGFEAWDRDRELRRIEEQLSLLLRSVNAPDVSAAEAHFQNAQKESAETLGRAKAAQERARKIAEELELKSDEFSNSALFPLNERIAGFNRVISPFNYTYRLKAKVNPTNTKVLQGLDMMETGMTGRRTEREPAAYLSEGQTAVISLSVLFATSVEYQWCRWPALLLDDPLQNTDLIHTAAFIDVIRGLMKDNGFQIFLSTHDMDEAEFIGRKCRASGLPVSIIRLLAAGPQGVRIKFETAT